MSQKWPYRPPSEHDVKPLSDVYRPPGYILLSEVVEMMGKVTLGEEWTGEELNARSLTNAILQESSHLENTTPWVPPGGIVYAGVDLSPIRERWKVITTRGDLFVSSEEEAQALWNQEKPKLLDMWHREITARRRHNTIARKVRTDLNAGTLQAWAHRTKVGDLVQIPPYVWSRDGIESVFALENNPITWRNPNIIKFSAAVGGHGGPVMVEGRVLLSGSDVQTYVIQMDHEANASGAGTSAAEHECARWIAELASGGYRPANREAVRQKATDKWGQRLSDRSFERAWASAAPGEWRKPGRKRKG
jgi:hypothetical protein